MGRGPGVAPSGTGGLRLRGGRALRCRGRELGGRDRGDRGLRGRLRARTGARRRRGRRRGAARCLGGGLGGRGAGLRGCGTCRGGRRGRRGLRGRRLAGRARLGSGLRPLPPGPCSASVNLRTTGASIVEDAERTNSPSSWSLAMTTLLSTPNSLASSYTRTLATSLLLGPGYRRTVATSWAYSSRTHRVLIAISTYFQLARYLTARGPVPFISYVSCGVARSTNRVSAAVSNGPSALKARGNARRRTARSRQTETGCT